MIYILRSSIFFIFISNTPSFYFYIFRYLLSRNLQTKFKAKNLAISLGLWKDNVDFVHGALRNIQLANIFFPKWTVRVLIPKNTPKPKVEVSIKENVIQKMKVPGAEIVYIDMKAVKIPVSLISSLIADDKSVTHFMVRDVRHRLSNCDAYEVSDFLTSAKVIHSVKTNNTYHSSNNKNTTILPELWEASRIKLLSKLGVKTMAQFIQVIVTSISTELNSHCLTI